MGVVLTMNRVELAGRLSLEPEYVVQEAQKPVKRCRIHIAVKRDRFRPDQEPETDFFPATAWGTNAETIAKYFQKGDPIVVCGELHATPYTDKHGVRRDGWYVEVKSFRFVESPSRGRQPDPVEEEPS